ncbi:MAG: serine/threonine-protein phosphatase [Gammaproteobacteria bacterium]|nr:MAG: serine/threonine-protein phosphatase [Gammaproteobacteria bacterium]
MQAGFHTDIGLRQENQDNALVDPELGLYAVADGVGGGSAGEWASACAIQALRQAVVEGLPLVDAVRAAHLAVEALQDWLGASDAATTLVAAHIQNGELEYAWVGDSRLYVLQDRQLHQLTEDHTVARVLGDDERVSRHMLTQALGAAPEEGLAVDSGTWPLTGSERLLLCSDGLYGALERDILFAEIVQPRQAQRTAEILVARALAAGGDDNVTVVVLDSDPGEAGRDAVDTDRATMGGAVNDSERETPEKYIFFGILLAILVFILIFFWA